MPQTPLDADVADFLDESQWTPPVVANATSKLNAWTRWLAPTAPCDATSRHLRDYLRERADTVSSSTRRDDWKMIRAFYRWAATPTRLHGGGLLKEDPMDGVKGPHVSQRPATRAAKADEVAALEDYFDGLARQRRAGGEMERARRNAAIVSLMFRSGVRSGEIPWIDLADLHQRPNGRPAIHLRAEHTKTGEARTVPVLPETERYLTRYLRARGSERGPLFAGRILHTRDRGGRLQAAAVQRVIMRAAKRCAIPVSAHQLRRGWTGEYLRAGGDVLSLEVVGGWADHRMPRRYLADEEAAAAIDRFYDVADNAAGRRPLRSVR